MIHIEVRTPAVDPDHEHFAWAVIASLRVDGKDYDLEDPNSAIDLTLSVPNLRTGRSLHFEEDREEWARGLPAVYRGPELVAAAIADDQPIDHGDTRIEREAVSVPESACEAAVG